MCSSRPAGIQDRYGSGWGRSSEGRWLRCSCPRTSLPCVNLHGTPSGHPKNWPIKHFSECLCWRYLENLKSIDICSEAVLWQNGSALNIPKLDHCWFDRLNLQECSPASPICRIWQRFQPLFRLSWTAEPQDAEMTVLWLLEKRWKVIPMLVVHPDRPCE